MTMDSIDFNIVGSDMQYVEIELDPQEAAIGEAGTMMFMQDGIEMETVFGDGSTSSSGFIGKLMGAGKRLLTGESLFTTIYANTTTGKRRVAFAAPLSWQDCGCRPKPDRRNAGLPKGCLPLRRQGRVPGHRLSATARCRIFWRRGIHSAKAGR